MVEAMNRLANQSILPPTWLCRWPLLFALVALWVQPPTARAHRLDELLQAAFITIEPDGIRLELNLTPGVESFSTLLPLLDLDHDGDVSAVETEAYADLIRSELSLRLDERPLVLQVTDSQFSPLAEFRTGLGTVHLKLSATGGTLTTGSHELLFHNRHLANLSVYLVNAVMPRSPKVQVQRQVRNTNQSEVRVTFTHRCDPAPTQSSTTPSGAHSGLAPLARGTLSIAAITFAGFAIRLRRRANDS
jgi:hypothetical protein